MKKRYRFFIILAVLGLGFYFVWPSIKWYFLTAQADKDMAESSRNQIKVYAQERADTAVKALLALDPSTALPVEYTFLVPNAQKMLEAMKKGDRVVTIGGLHGTVDSVKDNEVVLRVDDNVKLKFQKSAISTVVERGSGDSKE